MKMKMYINKNEEKRKNNNNKKINIYYITNKKPNSRDHIKQ